MRKDGAPAMMDKNEGITEHLKREMNDPSVLISFHCILHQQNLCAKPAILNDTWKKITCIVNYIRVNATKQADLTYHSKVCWMSQRNVLV